jgi:hypothetical protein
VLSTAQQDVSRWFADQHRPPRPGNVRGRAPRTSRNRLPDPGRRRGVVRLPAAAVIPRRRSPDRARRGRHADTPSPAGAIDLPRRDIQVAGAGVPARSHKCTPLPARLGRTWPATAPTCGLSGG